MGVVVSIGLELWMAYRIASHVGVRLEKPTDVFAYVSKWVSAIAAVGFLFVHVLRATFTLIAALPINLPATALAEFVVTNLFGVGFWLLFEGVKRGEHTARSFVLRSCKSMVKMTLALLRHQFAFLRQTASLRNLKLVRDRLRAFLLGERGDPDVAKQRGEIFAAAASAVLLINRGDQLRGPLGEVFLQSLRDRYSDLPDTASSQEISDYLKAKDYSAEELEGVVQMVKGKMFERLVEIHENADGDEWSARLHSDESHPGSDITFTNARTGQEIEVSLKATDNPDLIEAALQRYPDIPVLTTFGVVMDDSRVAATDISNEELERVSRRGVDEMMRDAPDGLDAGTGVGGTTVYVRICLLWPHVASYLRGKSTREELAEELSKELGQAGRVLATRIVLTAALGPVYVWYLLARGILELTSESHGEDYPILRLERRQKLMLA